jgi:polysaccharide deacetylase 2 family uncharacterized protein YibQ
MPPKNKPRSRTRTAVEKPARVPRSVKLLIVSLVVLGVGGAAGVKFLQSTRGGVFLVDQGFDEPYARVQREVGVALKRALAAHGLRKRIRAEGAAVPSSSGAPGTPAEWSIACDDSIDLLRVNVSLTEAIEAIGAEVRASEQFDHGHTLSFQVGTRTRDTHRLTLRRLAPAELQAAIPPPERLPKVAIVIDDFGYSDGGIPREVLDLDLPLTVAILPGLRHSHDVLTLAKKSHRCVLLHLPMEGSEPRNHDVEPITQTMSDAEIASFVRAYLESLPGVDGVNNHMGSVATADARVMGAVMGALEGSGLFFLDSLTSPKSVAYNTAVAAGVRAASNSMFLDDHTDRQDDVAARLHTLVETARARGQAIGIGHPHPWTFEALRDNLDYLETAGVELVTVCDIVRGAPGDSAR